MRSENQQRRRRRRRWWQPCFGSPTTSEDGELGRGKSGGHDASCFSWSRFGKLKRSPSVGRAAATIAAEPEPEPEPEFKVEEEAKEREEKRPPRRIPSIVVETVNPSFLQRWFLKGHWRNNSQPKSQVHVTTQPNLPHPPVPIDTNHPGPAPFSSSQPGPDQTKSQSRTNSPRMDPIASSNRQHHKKRQDSITTSRFNSTKPNKRAHNLKIKSDATMGLLVMMLIMVMLVVGGRAFAVLCTCAFFYLFAFVKTTSPSLEDREISKEMKPIVEIDYDSEEYKKKVLMEGLLERKGRRAQGSHDIYASLHT